ncbi:MAG TPA: hypothetical protein VKM72_06455 [Thermoanaerobaculia bacterium]|nr:hypothetical protein [Thermoanaerobaculia bacterium]
MKITTFRVLLVLLVLTAAAAPAAAVEHRLGLGVHAWKPASELLDDLSVDNERDLAGVLSYQLVVLSPLKLEVDLEYFPNGFGGSGEEAWAPQVLVVLGDRWYVAAGTGWVYSRELAGDFSPTIYIARLGLDLPILPRLRLDVSADERAADLDGLADVDEDTVTFAAVLRFRL